MKIMRVFFHSNRLLIKCVIQFLVEAYEFIVCKTIT